MVVKMVILTPLELIFPELEGRLYRPNADGNNLLVTEANCLDKQLVVKDKGTTNFIPLESEDKDEIIASRILTIKKYLTGNLIHEGLPYHLFDKLSLEISSSPTHESFTIDQDILTVVKYYKSLLKPHQSLNDLSITPNFITDRGYFTPSPRQLCELESKFDNLCLDYINALNMWLEFIFNYDISTKGLQELYSSIYSDGEFTSFKVDIPRIHLFN